MTNTWLMWHYSLCFLFLGIAILLGQLSQWLIASRWSSQEFHAMKGPFLQMMILKYHKVTKGGLFPSTELARVELRYESGFISSHPGPFILCHIASHHTSARCFSNGRHFFSFSSCPPPFFFFFKITNEFMDVWPSPREEYTYIHFRCSFW